MLPALVLDESENARECVLTGHQMHKPTFNALPFLGFPEVKRHIDSGVERDLPCARNLWTYDDVVSYFRNITPTTGYRAALHASQSATRAGATALLGGFGDAPDHTLLSSRKSCLIVTHVYSGIPLQRRIANPDISALTPAVRNTHGTVRVLLTCSAQHQFRGATTASTP
jgi:hypothetical protein